MTLAERNAAATLSCFGAVDPLHVTALNTLTLVRLREKRPPALAVASSSAALDAARSRDIDDELRLEAQFLAVSARLVAGGSIVSLVRDVFLRMDDGEAAAVDRWARERLTPLLHKYADDRRSETIVLHMGIRAVAEALLVEFERSGAYGNQADLRRSLSRFVAGQFAPRVR